MSPHSMLNALIRFDRWSWYFFIIWFGTALILYIAQAEAASLVAYWGIVLILINNLFRLLFVAEQFRVRQQPRYRLLAYLLLVVLLVSIGVQMLRS